MSENHKINRQEPTPVIYAHFSLQKHPLSGIRLPVAWPALPNEIDDCNSLEEEIHERSLID
jgi:hypothetical protein